MINVLKLHLQKRQKGLHGGACRPFEEDAEIPFGMLNGDVPISRILQEDHTGSSALFELWKATCLRAKITF